MKVSYLGEVIRLNGSRYTDVYFSCSVNGSFLHWQYDYVQLRAFRMGEVSRTYVIADHGFNYTTTLLSSQPIPNDPRSEALDSVLVLSFLDIPPRQFQVTCTSDFDYLTRNFQSNQSKDLITNGTIDSVLLNFVLSNQIVQNRAHTYVFVCGVAYDRQLVNAGGSLIGFSSQDEIGKTKTLLSPDGRTTNILGILIFRDILQTATLFFIPRDSAIEVVCSSGNHQASISTNDTKALPEPSTVPSSVPTTYQLDNQVDTTQSYHGIGKSNTVYPEATLNRDKVMVQTTMVNPISRGGKIMTIIIIIILFTVQCLCVLVQLYVIIIIVMITITMLLVSITLLLLTILHFKKSNMKGKLK